jgi:hypothetical protein
MLNQTQYKHKKSELLTIYFYITQSKKTNLQILVQFLRAYGLLLHRITSPIRRILTINQTETQILVQQSNYIAVSHKQITKEQFFKIMQLLSLKHSKHITFGFYYQNRIWRFGNALQKANNTLYNPFLPSRYELFTFNE